MRIVVHQIPPNVFLSESLPRFTYYIQGVGQRSRMVSYSRNEILQTIKSMMVYYNRRHNHSPDVERNGQELSHCHPQGVQGQIHMFQRRYQRQILCLILLGKQLTTIKLECLKWTPRPRHKRAKLVLPPRAPTDARDLEVLQCG